MFKEYNEFEKILQESLNKTKDLSLYEKYEYMLKTNKISISSIQRIFNYSYPRAKHIIEELIDCEAIEKIEEKYIFKSAEKYLNYAFNKTQNYIDNKGNQLLKAWCDLWDQQFNLLNKYSTKEFNIKNFTDIVKNTYQYFKQLNDNNSLPMCSKDNISFHSCLRIISIINQYSRNKIVILDYDFDDFEDLNSNHQAKQLLTIKASQLIAEALSFAISLIPKQKLNNIIGIIYNGTTTNYNIESENIEEIIKIVFENPYSEH